MAQLERYMNAYKEYETLIRASGRDPKDVEDESPEVEAKRLYMFPILASSSLRTRC